MYTCMNVLDTVRQSVNGSLGQDVFTVKHFSIYRHSHKRTQSYRARRNQCYIWQIKFDESLNLNKMRLALVIPLLS